MGPQVLVVGAGPVGLTMAAELARYGVAVRIIDKAAARTDKSKALVLWSRTLELIDRMGCAPSFVEAGMKVTGANIVADGRQLAHISLDIVGTPYPYALMLPQSETERLMEQHLNACGVEVERQVECVRLDSGPEDVAAVVRHADGREESVSPAWLVACDGAHSLARHALGMPFEGDTLPSDWVLADLHLAGLPIPANEIAVYWHARGLLAIFPIAAGRYRVIADVGEARLGDPRVDPTLTQIQSLLDERGAAGVTATSAIWLSAFTINERKVASYRSGRVFLAGDAAHIHSPAGGQGMNTGMQDACNLAWKLALAIRGLADPEPLLDSYSAERSEIGRQVLKAAGALTAVATVKGRLLQVLRNHAAALAFGLSPVRRAMSNAMSELSIGYPDGPLTRAGDHRSGPAAGQRAPIPGGVPVGAGDTPRFALFADASPEGDALIARYPDLLEAKVRPAFGERGVWLVRPDGYVAATADQGGWKKIGAALEAIVGPPRATATGPRSR